MKFKNTPNKSYNIDGKIIWASRSPALVGVIFARFKGKDYVLIAKRGKGAADFQGFWNLPCGYLDWDESGFEGICREMFEETGLDIQDILVNLDYKVLSYHINQPFYVNTDPKESRQNVSLTYGIYFSCAKKLPELTTEHSEPDEVEEVKWVNVDEIENYQFTFDHDKRIKMFFWIKDNEEKF